MAAMAAFDPIAGSPHFGKTSPMSKFTVTHGRRDGDEPFSPYVFEVFFGGLKVAELGHDYRGDEHRIRLPGREWIELPERVIEGGGPNLPFTLSSAGEKAIERLIAE
jgi:hypothetical protein